MELYLKWIANRGLFCSTGNSAQCYVAAWMGGEFGGKWIYVYEWLSPFASHLLFIGYTPIQNKKLEVWEKIKRYQGMNPEKTKI